MPLDTSIPLQAKAPEFNPLATMLQVGQYKYLQQNSNRLQMDTDANQAVGQAIQRNTGSDGKVNLLAVQKDLAGDPAAAYNLQGTTGTNLSQQGQQTQNGTAQIQQQGAQLSLTSDQQAHMAQQLGTLLAKPDLSYADAIHTAAQAGQMYGLPPEIIRQSVASMPTDPTQLKPYIQSRLAALQAPGQQLDAMTPGGGQIDTGPTTAIINNRPAAGPIGKPVAVYNKGLSPEGATAPTQIGTDPSGAPIYGTRDQFIQKAAGGGVTGVSPYQTNASAGAAQYEQGLNQRTQAANTSQHYITEAQGLMDGIRTGGGQATRTSLAQRAQAIGLPQSVVDGIAGGNLGDIQVLQKMLVQNAVQQMQTSFNGTGGQANVDLFLKNNPNILNDPRAIPKLMQFASGMNGATSKEQQAYRTFINGGGNPADFPAKWNTSTTMRAFTGQIQPVKTGTYNGRKVVQYSDGSVDYQ